MISSPEQERAYKLAIPSTPVVYLHSAARRDPHELLYLIFDETFAEVELRLAEGVLNFTEALGRRGSPARKEAHGLCNTTT